MSSPCFVVGAQSVPSASYVSIRSRAAGSPPDVDLTHPRVEADPEALELRADHAHHQLDGIALARRDLLDVVAAVAVLRRLLPTPPRLDRFAEELDLTADVVVVVLALDVVPGELEQPRDGVAVRGVPRRADGERPRRVGGHELYLDALLDVGRARPVVVTRLEDLGERVAEPLRREARG